MKLTPPTKLTFWISIILILLGIVAQLVTIPVLSGLAFWVVVVGAAVLVAGLLFKGF